LLLLWHGHVHVNLRSSATKPTGPPSHYSQDDHDDKNYEHGNYTRTAASASIVVGHIDPLIGELVVVGKGVKGMS
jgi:hypothetical protein